MLSSQAEQLIVRIRVCEQRTVLRLQEAMGLLADVRTYLLSYDLDAQRLREAVIDARWQEAIRTAAPHSLKSLRPAPPPPRRAQGRASQSPRKARRS